MVLIEYFGPAKDFTLKSSEEVTLTHHTIKGLLNHFQNQYGEDFMLFVLRSCGITINLEYVEIPNNPENQADEELLKAIESLDVTFSNSDEISIIPPVSSG
jgi:molybdopterin converting factor small subunit